MVPAATAADGGGSIRIPAACCGLVGMKPTRGRVSLMPLGDDWLALGVYGALARTVRDSAALLDVMHGPVEGDRDRAPEFTGSYAEAAVQEPSRLRIAMSRKIPPGLIGKVSADQRAAWERMGRTLEALGHDVHRARPRLRPGPARFRADVVPRGLRDLPALPGPKSVRAVDPADGRGRPSPRPAAGGAGAAGQAHARRRRASSGYGTTSTSCSPPAWPRPRSRAEGGLGKPLPLAVDIAGRFTPFTPLFNLTGQPAISLPAGIGARRPAAQRAARRSPRRRGRPVLAGGADRERPAVGAAQASDELIRPPRAWRQRRAMSSARAPLVVELVALGTLPLNRLWVLGGMRLARAL